jgi:hypothetical protein
MRLRTRISCAAAVAIGVSSLATLGAGCVGDDNATPSGGDSGVDSTVNEPETSTPTPEASADAGTDSPASDAGQDATDSAVVVDTGVDAGCSPALAPGWTPPAYVPATGQYQFECRAPNGQAEVDQYWVACLGDASTPATCAAYPDASTDNPLCVTCLVSPEDASAYGAEVVRVVPQLNVAGCIQLADTTDAGYSCAAALQAVQACVEASCKPSCAVTSDPASVAAYVACAKAAATSSCNAFSATAAACVGAYVDAGSYTANACLSGTTDEQEFDDVGFFFCGS